MASKTVSLDIRELQRIVHLLYYYRDLFSLGYAGNHIHHDTQSQERNNLLCDRISIQQALPHLTVRQRQAFQLVAEEQLNETEAARRMNITRRALHQLLWRIAIMVLQPAKPKPKRSMLESIAA
jgi:DNA-directed RNA polymerase specialized sigma24 family protein